MTELARTRGRYRYFARPSQSCFTMTWSPATAAHHSSPSIESSRRGRPRTRRRLSVSSRPAAPIRPNPSAASPPKPPARSFRGWPGTRSHWQVSGNRASCCRDSQRPAGFNAATAVKPWRTLTVRSICWVGDWLAPGECGDREQGRRDDGGRPGEPKSLLVGHFRLPSGAPGPGRPKTSVVKDLSRGRPGSVGFTTARLAGAYATNTPGGRATAGGDDIA